MEHYQAISLIPGLHDVAFTLILLVLIWFVVPKDDRLIPHGGALAQETIYRSIQSFVKANVVKTAHVPLLWSAFLLLLMANLAGLIPQTVTPTTHLIVTLHLSLWLLGASLVQTVLRQKWHTFGLFLPAGTPLALLPMIVIIELLAQSTRLLSLGIRISVNMITGHTLVHVLSGFLWEALMSGVSLLILALPLTLLTVFLALEVLIAQLQAYIYTFVACITIHDQL